MLIINRQFIFHVPFLLQCTQVKLSLLTNDAQEPGTAWNKQLQRKGEKIMCVWAAHM